MSGQSQMQMHVILSAWLGSRSTTRLPIEGPPVGHDASAPIARQARPRTVSPGRWSRRRRRGEETQT